MKQGSRPPAPPTAGAPSLPDGAGAGLSPRSRTNGLPEHYNYLDLGCYIHSPCLTCPLPDCALNQPRALAGTLRDMRQRFVRYARTKQVPWPTIAAYLGVTLRTSFRLASDPLIICAPSAQRRLGSLDRP